MPTKQEIADVVINELLPLKLAWCLYDTDLELNAYYQKRVQEIGGPLNPEERTFFNLLGRYWNIAIECALVDSFLFDYYTEEQVVKFLKTYPTIANAAYEKFKKLPQIKPS